MSCCKHWCGTQGQATDIQIHAEEILHLKRVINGIYAKHTKQPIETIGENCSGLGICRCYVTFTNYFWTYRHLRFVLVFHGPPCVDFLFKGRVKWFSNTRGLKSIPCLHIITAHNLKISSTQFPNQKYFNLASRWNRNSYWKPWSGNSVICPTVPQCGVRWSFR